MRQTMIVLFCVALLAGCSASTSYPATFDHYEAVRIDDPDATGIFDFRMELTGNAFVTLDDGTQVKALCAVQGLEKGASINVQQNSDGSWAVTP